MKQSKHYKNMKHLELNIGLSCKDGHRINYIALLNSLTGSGFACASYRIVNSSCDDGEEQCLAWLGSAPSDWEEQLLCLSDRYGQDCIAWRACGFAGARPYDEFNEALFIPALPDADELATPQERINCKDSFVEYLTGTLIPDLEESGMEATAEDFKTCIQYMNQ